ncbi:MAG: hypothetical protein GXO36_06455, partial [Chloroflexi bacterium]|nr:hypothetical protein [Chloroflexota bacterium]
KLCLLDNLGLQAANPHVQLGLSLALRLGVGGLLIAALCARLGCRLRTFLTGFWASSLLIAAMLTGLGPKLPLCEADILVQHERAGAVLRAWVPDGARVYWAAYDATLLLYGPEVEIAPQQLNLSYNRYLDGDPEMLRRWGYWNTTLDEAWLRTADVALLDRRTHTSEGWAERLRARGYRFRGWLPSLAPCQPLRGDVAVWLRGETGATEASWFGTFALLAERSESDAQPMP